MRLRARFAVLDSSYLLPTLVCCVIGALVALLLVVFHGLIEWLIGLRGPAETLSPVTRVGLVMVGAAACWALLKPLRAYRDLGTGHVVRTLQSNPRRWPLGNAALMFFLTPLLLASGQAGGREGPAIQLGAAVGGQFTHALKLPRNTLTVFVGAGAAAAISATFDTPLAGVAFAMEVIVLEYSVAGFLPVMAAAVVATLVMGALFGQAPVTFPDTLTLTDPAMVWVVMLGLAAGLVSASFNSVALAARRLPVKNGILWAGVLCAAVALVLPEVMGSGDRHFNGILTGEWSVIMLAALMLAKILVTAASVGLGMPLGVISSLLTIGACLGVGLASLTQGSLSLGLLGMVAVMGASLNAPLAALLAAVELSGQQGLMTEGLVVVAIAVLTHRLLGRTGFFFEGLPKAAHLRRSVLDHLGAEAALESRVVQVPARFKTVPAKTEWVVWRAGPRSVKALRWADFEAQTARLNRGDSLESLENALTLARADAQMTLAEIARTAICSDGCYLREPNGSLPGLVLKSTIEERFS